MAHWQGYLRRDREFFGGLTEINRTPLGSILLRENLAFINAWRRQAWLVSLAFGPRSPFFSLPHIWLSVIRFHQQLTLLSCLPCGWMFVMFMSRVWVKFNDARGADDFWDVQHDPRRPTKMINKSLLEIVCKCYPSSTDTSHLMLNISA